MPEAHLLSVQNYIGSGLRTSAVWTIALFDLVHGDIKDCYLQ